MSVNAISIVQTLLTTEQKVRGFYTLIFYLFMDTSCISLECEILDGYNRFFVVLPGDPNPNEEKRST